MAGNNKIREFWSNPYYRFIGSFLLLYLVLYWFNIFFIGITAPGGLYSKFLDDHLNYIRWWRTFSLESSATIIRWLGYRVVTNATQLGVFGKAGFTLVYKCLGYGIMSAFTAFVITFPKPLKSKLIFLFGGLIFIQLLNIFRFVYLSLYWNHRKLIFGFDHHDLFNFCIYLIMMVMCYIWINYSTKNERNQTHKSL